MSDKPVTETPESPGLELASGVQYRGRKASRESSEQRRQAILDAAMRIIVRDGVRAIRHRAVAAEAQVPLSATTYYFKDIDDLITDTFALFVERSAANLAAFWANAETELQQIAAHRDGDEDVQRQMVRLIVEKIIEYIRRQLISGRDRLMAEQALRLEALINPRLQVLANAHRKILWHGVDRFFEALGSTQPLADAQALIPIVLRMEYQGLLDGVENLEIEDMRSVLTRYLYLVMRL